MKIICLLGLEGLKSRLNTAVDTVLQGSSPVLLQHWIQFSKKIILKKAVVCFIYAYLKIHFRFNTYLIFVERNFDTLNLCTLLRLEKMLYSFCTFLWKKIKFFFSYQKARFRPLQRYSKRLSKFEKKRSLHLDLL